MIEESTLRSLRARLEDERAQLAAHIASLGSDSVRTFDDNFADSGQVAAEKGETTALAGRLREQLEEVEHALARCDSGAYGLCESCGRPIGDARLEAMPAARFCIDHA